MEQIDIAALARQMMDAVQSGNGWLIAATALVIVVSLVRAYGGHMIPALNTKVGGWVTLFLLASAGALATAIGAGAAVTGALALKALGIGFAAAGGYQAIKDLLPELKPILVALLRALKLMKSAEEVIAGAEAAGEKAAEEAKLVGAPVKVMFDMGTMGKPTPEQIRAVHEKLMADGYELQADGTYKRVR